MSSPGEESVARAASSAVVEMVEEARRGVVEVRSGGRGSGAGVIWPGEGLVLTNNHVVAWGGRRRRGGVRVTLQDGRALEAEVVKRSRGLDLALLRLRGDTGGLPAVPVGDSDALRVGELVFAIGHPWGNPGRATAGGWRSPPSKRAAPPTPQASSWATLCSGSPERGRRTSVRSRTPWTGATPSPCGSCAGERPWSWRCPRGLRGAPRDAGAGVRRGPDADGARGAALHAPLRRGGRGGGGGRVRPARRRAARALGL